jgi:hypothetical protein
MRRLFRAGKPKGYTLNCYQKDENRLNAEREGIKLYANIGGTKAKNTRSSGRGVVTTGTDTFAIIVYPLNNTLYAKLFDEQEGEVMTLTGEPVSNVVDVFIKYNTMGIFRKPRPKGGGRVSV